jgi:hypothetical protein
MQEFAGKLTGTGMRNCPHWRIREILLRTSCDTGHLVADLAVAALMMTGPD